MRDDHVDQTDSNATNRPIFAPLIMEQTLQQFRTVVGHCRGLFVDKTRDYGTAWRILRPSSLTDQLYIKALRIRSIEEKGTQRVADPVEGEFVGLINYSVMALIQLELPASAPLELPVEEATRLYDHHIEENIRLLAAKNHDYGEAWRAMRVSSMTDLILQKLLRIKQIEDNQGQTIVSEGLDANYRDIINYAVFALIQLGAITEA
jgi:Nucleotide modification associated domain 1